MKNKTNKVSWAVFVVLAIAIGLYPLTYLFVDERFGILGSKSEELLANALWIIGFYGHVFFGGLALLIGWIQFSKRLRSKYLKLHRNVGKLYIIAVIISGVSGVYIAFYANGGIIASLGFLFLALIWLFTTLKAFFAIRKRDISLHKGFMIYSYAACFAAVTLRIWLPLLSVIFDDFNTAYRIVAWLCWVPNMIFAFFWVRKRGFVIG